MGTDENRKSPVAHTCYTNNTGLEAPFHAPVLLVVPEAINLTVALCKSFIAILVAMHALVSQDGTWNMFLEL